MYSKMILYQSINEIARLYVTSVNNTALLNEYIIPNVFKGKCVASTYDANTQTRSAIYACIVYQKNDQMLWQNAYTGLLEQPLCVNHNSDQLIIYKYVCKQMWYVPSHINILPKYNHNHIKLNEVNMKSKVKVNTLSELIYIFESIANENIQLINYESNILHIQCINECPSVHIEIHNHNTHEHTHYLTYIDTGIIQKLLQSVCENTCVYMCIALNYNIQLFDSVDNKTVVRIIHNIIKRQTEVYLRYQSAN